MLCVVALVTRAVSSVSESEMLKKLNYCLYKVWLSYERCLHCYAYRDTAGFRKRICEQKLKTSKARCFRLYGGSNND